MNYIVVVFGTGAFVTGIVAAYKWYKASVVQIDMGYHPPGLPGGTFRRLGQEFPRFPEPGDFALQQMSQTAATWAAMNESSELNRAAARWTAALVALGAVANLLPALMN